MTMIFTGQLYGAMPGMGDPRFDHRLLIFICRGMRRGRDGV